MASRVNGRITDRFEVGHYIEGLIATEKTKADAIATAVRWVTSSLTDYPDALRDVRVYDSMAHIGQAESYATQDGKAWYPVQKKTKCITHCILE